MLEKAHYYPFRLTVNPADEAKVKEAVRVFQRQLRT
jgi:hypothetical protein